MTTKIVPACPAGKHLIVKIKSDEDLKILTQAQARAWLIAHDPEGTWATMPEDTDFVAAVRDDIKDFGYDD